MSSISYEETAAAGLEELGLAIAREHLDTAAQLAAAESWSYSHFLGYLLEGELRYRREKTVRLSLQFSNLPYHKTLDEFDFAQQPAIDRRLIDELATGRFLSEGRNIVLLGPPGVGKTHLAIALGMLTAQSRYRIYFTSAIDMARRKKRAGSLKIGPGNDFRRRGPVFWAEGGVRSGFERAAGRIGARFRGIRG